jgi:uncharacterized protein (DUF1330 family)
MMLLSLFLAASAATATPPAAPKTCKDPVYLVVWIEHLDRTKSKAYGDGLRSSGIVARHGGEYQAVSPPALVLEGKWPADRGFVVERYPCMEGSGDYTVAVFNAFKRPAPAKPANSQPAPKAPTK